MESRAFGQGMILGHCSFTRLKSFWLAILLVKGLTALQRGEEIMAKRRNKAAKIRAALTEMGTDTAPKDVIAALKAQRVKVTPQQVYMAKTQLGKSKGSKRDSSPYASLLAAKQLVDKLGSVDKAREALDVLAKLT
jgi:hypothetical protein